MFWRELGGLSRWPTSWQELTRLQEDMNRLFSDALGSRDVDYPAVNLWVNQENALVTAEIPGVDPESLDISVVEDTLTIKGDRPAVELKEGESYHRRERGQGEFARTVALPFRVDRDRVAARYERGILTLTLPRTEADKPRKIAIKAA